MIATIRTTDNGFLVTYDHYTEDDTTEQRHICIEEDDALPIETAQHRAYARLCWELMDVLGVFNSKHHPERVSIEMEKQGGE